MKQVKWYGNACSFQKVIWLKAVHAHEHNIYLEDYITWEVPLIFPPFFFAFFDIANKKSLIEFLLRFEIFNFFRQLLSKGVKKLWQAKKISQNRIQFLLNQGKSRKLVIHDVIATADLYRTISTASNPKIKTKTEISWVWRFLQNFSSHGLHSNTQ